MIQVGHIQDGYRYAGGDPSNPNSWRKLPQVGHVQEGYRYTGGDPGVSDSWIEDVSTPTPDPAPELPDIQPAVPVPTAPQIGVDVETVQEEEAFRAQLGQEFGWLDNPFKSKDPATQEIIEQMGMVWRSPDFRPSQKLDRLQRLKQTAQNMMASTSQLTQARQAAEPTTQERMFLEKSTSGDVLRTAGSAATSVAQMLNAIDLGVTEIAVKTGIVPDSVLGKMRGKEAELAENAAGLMAEIEAQGGEAAAVAQTIGQQALVTAIRLAALNKIPKSPSAIVNHMRLPLLTALTTPGSAADRAKAAGRMLLLSSTPYGAKPLGALTKLTGAKLAVATAAIDAGLNFGLSNLFGYYDYDSPRSWIPALITDIAFAGGTGFEVSKALKEKYKAQVGEKQAAEDFRAAEAARKERVQEKAPESLDKEQARAEVEAEINRMVMEPARVEVPTPSPEEARMLPPRTAYSRAVEPLKPEVQKEIQDAIQKREAKEVPRVEAPEAIPRVEAEARVEDKGKARAEVKPTPPAEPRAEKAPELMTREEFIKVGPDGYDDAANIGWSKTGGEHALAVDIAVDVGRPVLAVNLDRYPESKEYALRQGYTSEGDRYVFKGEAKPAEAPKLPAELKEQAPPQAVKIAETKLAEAERVKETDAEQAVLRTIEAQKELERPQTAKELNQLSTANLKKLAKQHGIDTAAMPKEPSRSELVGAVKRAQERDAQYDDGIVEPVKNLADRQRIINKTLGIKKPMTPEQREAYAHKLGVAEGKLAGQIAGVQEGMLTKEKAIKQAMREGKKTVDVLQRSLHQMTKALSNEDRTVLGKPIAEVKDYKGYEKVVGKIMDRLDNAERKAALAQIGEDVKAYRKTQVTPEIKEAMSDEIARILGVEDPAESSAELLRRAKTMNIDELSSLRDTMAILKAASDKTVVAKKAADKQAHEKRVAECKEAIGKAAPIVGLTFGKDDDIIGARKTAKVVRWAMLNLWARVKMADGGKKDGAHYKAIIKSLLTGTREHDDVYNRASDVIADIKDIVPLGWGARETTVQAGGKTIPLTHAQKIGLYLTSLRASGMRDMMKSGVTADKPGAPIYKFTMEDINRLWNSMTETELHVATKLIEGIDKVLTPAQRKAYIELNHHDIPWLEDNYWRTFVERELLSVGEQPGAKDYNVENVGWLKPKTGGRAILLNDALDTFAKLTMQTARYAGFAKPMREIKALMNDPAWQSEMTKKFGADFTTELAQHIKNIEGKPGPESGLERVFLGGLRNIASSYINANPRTILKQLPSMVNIVDSDIPLKYFLRNLNTIVKPDELFSSPTIKKRYREHGWEREASEAYAARGRLQQARRFMGRDIRAADKLAISRAWASTKDWLATEQGLKGEALLKATQDKMEEIIARTQPTSDPLNQTLLQAEKGLVPKVFTLFSSQRSKLNNMLIERSVEMANAKTKAEKQEAGAALATMLALYVGNATAMTGLDLTFLHGWRKLMANAYKAITGKNIGKVRSGESAQQQMAAGILRNLLGMLPAGREVYTAGEALANVVAGGLKQAVYLGRFDSALQSGIKDIVKGLDDIFDSEKELVDRLYALIVATDRITGIGLGVPLQYVKEAFTPEETINRWRESNWQTMRRAYLKDKRSAKDMLDWIEFSELPKETEDKYKDRFFNLVVDQYKDGKLSKEDALSVVKQNAQGSMKTKYLTRIANTLTKKVEKEGK